MARVWHLSAKIHIISPLVLGGDKTSLWNSPQLRLNTVVQTYHDDLRENYPIINIIISVIQLTCKYQPKLECESAWITENSLYLFMDYE